MSLISVNEAASILGVSDRQIRRLAADGVIEHERVGGRWLIERDSAVARARGQSASGRPVSARVAWALLEVLSEHDEPNPWHVVDDRQLRWRIKALLRKRPPTSTWNEWLRRRAHPERVWVHPGVEARLLADPAIAQADVNHFVGTGIAVRPDDLQRLYTRDRDRPGLMQRYQLRTDREGLVVLMSVPDDAAPLGGDRLAIPWALAVVDLLESADARQRHAAALLLEDAAHQVEAAGGG